MRSTSQYKKNGNGDGVRITALHMNDAKRLINLSAKAKSKPHHPHRAKKRNAHCKRERYKILTGGGGGAGRVITGESRNNRRTSRLENAVGEIIRRKCNYWRLEKGRMEAQIARGPNELHTLYNLIAHFCPKPRKDLGSLNKHIYRQQVALI